MTQAQAEEVFALLGAQWPAGSIMRVFARNKFGHTRGDTILDPEMLANWTEHATRMGWNCYVQMNPTRKKGTGRTSGKDVTAWSWFLVDLDPITDTPELDLARKFVEHFMSNYLGMMHLKYHLIDSGRGWQMWFPLHSVALKWDNGPMGTNIIVRTDPLARDFELSDTVVGSRILPLREAAPRAMSFWLNMMKQRMEQQLPDCGVTIDTSVSDLPRVMRMPYTRNVKTGRETSILRKTLGWNPGLGEKLISYAPYSVWKEDEYADVEMPEGASWHLWLTHPGMKVNARIYLTEGVSEGGRHKAATAALLALKELGCPAEQTQAALLWGASLCTPPLQPREITPMIQRHFRGR